MNRVEVIGVCLDVTSDYIIIKVDNTDPIKMFFNEEINVELIEIGKYTKVLGFLEVKDFPFPIVKVEKVFQLKENVN